MTSRTAEIVSRRPSGSSAGYSSAVAASECSAPSIERLAAASMQVPTTKLLDGRAGRAESGS